MKAWKVSKYTGKFPASFNRRPDVLESFWMVWKVSRWSEKFSGGLDSFQVVWIVSRWLETFPDGLESFQMVWTDSRWSGQFPDGLDSFHMAWKPSRWPGKFPDGLKSFQMFWKLSIYIKTFQVYKNFPGSIATLLPWFFHSFVGTLDYWSIGPLVECQMLNVNKVKLLSERTSGVPPVIFELYVV